MHGKTNAVGIGNIEYCEVSNAAGMVASRTAVFTINKLPVLNNTMPEDAEIIQSADGVVNLNVSIAEEGYPSTYTYQWYKNNTAIEGATNSSYNFTDMSIVGTFNFYCIVNNGVQTVQSRTAAVTIKSYLPTYTYSGSHELIKDGNYNWRIKLKTTGSLNFSSLGAGNGAINVFLVGGGGSGGSGCGGGGGGGRTTNGNYTITTGTPYTVTVAAGGAGGALGWGTGPSGGTTSAFGLSASGGSGGQGNTQSSFPSRSNRNGGSGGSGGGGGYWYSWGGGAGGSYGSSGSSGGVGSDGVSSGGSGQGTTTREFGESSGQPYAGGGGGSGASDVTGGNGGTGGGGNGYNASAGTYSAGAVNTGGGGGGVFSPNVQTLAGGSGIVVIRNKRS